MFSVITPGHLSNCTSRLYWVCILRCVSLSWWLVKKFIEESSKACLEIHKGFLISYFFGAWILWWRVLEFHSSYELTVLIKECAGVGSQQAPLRLSQIIPDYPWLSLIIPDYFSSSLMILNLQFRKASEVRTDWRCYHIAGILLSTSASHSSS